MSQPTPKEITVSARTGGKVQIVKFELSGDYSYSAGGTWTIPEDWSDSQVEEFRQYQLSKLIEELEGPAQNSLDDLYRQRDDAS